MKIKVENGKAKIETADDLQALYLDYVNNFITRKKFADFYGLSQHEADAVIIHGRRLQETMADFHKQFVESSVTV